MDSEMKAMAKWTVSGALVADALALGPHWIYQQDEIGEKIEDFTRVTDPMSSYHPGKKAGDLTHYGDQSLLLLQSLAGTGSFEPDHYSDIWRGFWENPETRSYCDGATRETLNNLKEGISPLEAGSVSEDLAGASRCAPMLLATRETESCIYDEVRQFTSMSHSNNSVVEASEFFMRVAILVLDGIPITQAITQSWQSREWHALDAAWLSEPQSMIASGKSDNEVASEMGLGCDIRSAFPLTCYYLLKYPDTPIEALTANYKAGGDSAARGMILGMCFGSHPDMMALTKRTLPTVSQKTRITELINQLVEPGQ